MLLYCRAAALPPHRHSLLLYNKLLFSHTTSLQDSTLNQHAKKVLIFNSIGIERVINTFTDPSVVTHDITYRPCPKNGA